MIEKPKRPKQPSIQERQPPRTLQELINRYDLDNTKIYDFLDELVSQVNKEQDDLQSQINNKNIITAGLSGSVTLTSTGEKKITLNSIKDQVGVKFNLQNGKIYVGPGIKNVLVSGCVYTNRASNSGTACNVYIYKNGARVLSSINSVNSGTGNQSISIDSILKAVSEGDYFELGCYGYNGDSISDYMGTHLTLQAIN